MSNDIMKTILAQHTGVAIEGMRFKVAGIIYSQSALATFGSVSISYVESVLDERQGDAKLTKGLHRAAYFKTKAALLNNCIATYLDAFNHMKEIPHSFYQEVLDIYPSKAPLCEVLTIDRDARMYTTFLEQYNMMVTERKSALREVAAAMEVSVIPYLCVKDMTVIFTGELDDDETAAQELLKTWFHNNVGVELNAVMDEPFIAKITCDQIRSVNELLSGYVKINSERPRSFSALELINALCRVLSCSSALVQNVAPALEYREYTILPINHLEKHALYERNDDLTGEKAVFFPEPRDKQGKAIASSGVKVRFNDHSLTAMFIARILEAAVNSNTIAASVKDQFKMSDLLISCDQLLNRELLERVIYESAKLEDEKMELTYMSFMTEVFQTRHSRTYLAELAVRYTACFEEDVAAVSKYVHKVITSPFTARVGDAVDAIRKTDGTKERWYLSPQKDELEYSLNSGGLKSIIQTGRVSMRSTKPIEEFRDWATGTIEGSAEGIIVKDSLMENLFTETVDQNVVISAMGDAMKYYTPSNTRVTFDLTANTALDHVSNFKSKDRWYQPGSVKTVINLTDFTQMCRTVVDGNYEMFRFVAEDHKTMSIAGTAIMASESSESYVCVDKCITIGKVSKVGANAPDTMFNTAGDVVRLVTRDLLNGYFSQVKPPVLSSKETHLEQISVRALKRLGTLHDEFELISVDSEITSRFRANPIMHDAVNALFPTDEAWNYRHSELFIRKDLANQFRRLIDVHVRTIKRQLGSTTSLKYTLSYIRGTITEADLDQMKNDSRGIDVANLLIAAITSVVGFSFSGKEVKTSGHYALKVFLLNELLKKIEDFASLKTKITRQDVV